MARPFDFTDDVKKTAFKRQWNKCALCGRRLLDTWDHAHHVIPNQVGIPNDPDYAVLRTERNCVILCDQCHPRVHQDGKYVTGAVPPPSYYEHSHGHERALHVAWAMELDIIANELYAKRFG